MCRRQPTRPSLRGARALLLWGPTFAIFLCPVHAATLKPETVKAWEEYIQAVDCRVRDRAAGRGTFLQTDESSDRAAKVREGKAVMTSATRNNPKMVPSGLIHDWIGAVFIPHTTLDRVLAVLRDYARYKDFFRPGCLIPSLSL
jgi:hypothetical protein